MSSPASSRPDPFDIAVVALSARALAASARRAGLKALAIDLFADADTREHAALAVQAAPSRRGMGFDRKRLLAALSENAPASLPVVLGAGFEHAPGLMRAIASRNPIVGASPEQVALLKDPSRFAALLASLNVPHPSLRTRRAYVSRPLPAGERWAAALDGDWLSKRVGASGGAHIRRGGTAGRRRYLQRFVEGRPVSALFLADGGSAQVIGYSEQWTDPAPDRPFRYGGAVGPIELPATLSVEIASALGRMVGATGLAGLASADLVVPKISTGPSFWLLEVNPRPGATLDVFDHGETPSMLGLHLDACAGRLPAALPAPAGARAAAIVYADHPVEIATLRRPLWTADWPSCDETLPAGAPVCTVLASATTPSAARALVTERRAALLASLRAAQKAAPINAMVPA